jgi:hypothetical protein
MRRNHSVIITLQPTDGKSFWLSYGGGRRDIHSMRFPPCLLHNRLRAHLLRLIVAALFLAVTMILRAQSQDPLEQNFAHPPDSARPWVYWFWNNGNITREGITADLEAMKRVGIGGVLIMDVVERFAPPVGPATYMGPVWMDMYRFALGEAHRLGLEMNMTNAPGWCGSSDPSITPELSMQVLVSTGTSVDGPAHFDGVLPQGHYQTRAWKDVPVTKLAVQPFYRDVAVLAFPAPVNGFVPNGQVIDISAKMTPDGHIAWDAPAGKWTIQRIGEVSTNSKTRPPVVGGVGLEVDKLSAAAMDRHFAAIMKKLIDAAGPLAGAGKTLVATHIDSWEVGGQNWTPLLAAEFQKRRGYDPIPFLPVVTGGVDIGGKALADRFRWDFNETIAELLSENYTGRIAALAHQYGLRFTLEGYHLPFGDEATYTAAADEPMTEFWTPGRFEQQTTKTKAHQMASVGHLYGRNIIGAESFTSDESEEWKQHPATIKALGDFEMTEGVNRFVFHRYAFQPYLDRFPGSTMGPWGLHYERTNTWWEWSPPWHQYVARCSYMLRQGLYVADLLYARPELPNQAYFTPAPAPPAGYQYDQASAQSIIQLASAADGRILLPDGMSYRLLVLPPKQTAMTPAFLHKLEALVSNGAFLSGPPPRTSPSLSGYPQCDQEVAGLARDLWGDCDGAKVTEHPYGKGRVFWGEELADILTKLKTPPDFISDAKLHWIHRHSQDADIYFLASSATNGVTAECTFRAPRLSPENWNPETGTMSLPALTASNAASQTLTIHLDPSGSTFIVFRAPGVVSKNLTVPFSDSPLISGTLAGPWTLRFPPKWGAPDQAVFPSLTSWTDSPIAGIRYFSGTATYSKKFTANPAWLQPGRRIALDLGGVQIMARVKLNGQDLGILWKPPFRVEVTGLLKQGDNDLEIDVVNLWPNRMIGDASLPADQRFTWSTWEPFKKETPLLTSGLLGPVTLQSDPGPQNSAQR